MSDHLKRVADMLDKSHTALLQTESTTLKAAVVFLWEAIYELAEQAKESLVEDEAA